MLLAVVQEPKTVQWPSYRDGGATRVRGLARGLPFGRFPKIRGPQSSPIHHNPCYWDPPKRYPPNFRKPTILAHRVKLKNCRWIVRASLQLAQDLISEPLGAHKFMVLPLNGCIPQVKSYQEEPLKSIDLRS